MTGQEPGGDLFGYVFWGAAFLGFTSPMWLPLISFVFGLLVAQL